jgi:RimJ/RimL family protein N-acetyltransferase
MNATPPDAPTDAPTTRHIVPARRVTGRQLVLRNAEVADAEFILSLRTDPQKSRHLSQVSGALQDQIDWLARYALGSDQAYFIIEDRAGERLGTVRLYDAQGDSFCWGSWILKDGRPSGAAIESALMVYAYAIDQLGFRAAHFDVRVENEGVWSFHERFGAVRVRSTDLDHFYTLGLDAIRASFQRYARFLPDPVTVEPLATVPAEPA